MKAKQSRSLRTHGTAPYCLLANKSMRSLKEADFKYRNLHCCHFSRTKDKNNSTSVFPILRDLQGLSTNSIIYRQTFYFSSGSQKEAMDYRTEASDTAQSGLFQTDP